MAGEIKARPQEVALGAMGYVNSLRKVLLLLLLKASLGFCPSTLSGLTSTRWLRGGKDTAPPSLNLTDGCCSCKGHLAFHLLSLKDR